MKVASVVEVACILTTAASAVAAGAEPSLALAERPVFRPTDEEPPENPYHESGDEQPGGTSYRPSGSTSSDGSGSVDSLESLQGTSSTLTNPLERDDDDKFAEKVIEAAKEVLDEIADALEDAGGGGSTQSTTAVSLPVGATPMHSISGAAATGGASVPGSNGTYIVVDD